MVTLAPDKHLAHRLEQSETEFWHRWISSLPAAVRAAHGLEAGRIGGAVLLSCRHEPSSSMLNRVVGAGVWEPATPALVSEILTHCTRAATTARLVLCPFAEPAGLADQLLARGFRRGGESAVLYADPAGKYGSAVVPRGLRIEEVGLEQSRLFGRVCQAGFASPPVVGEMAAGAPGIPGFACYLAYLDGQPVAAALLHVAGGVGFLGGCTVLPGHRGQGLQAALIARRVADARAAGCDLVASQIRVDSVGHGNLAALSFHLAYIRPHYVDSRA